MLAFRSVETMTIARQVQGNRNANKDLTHMTHAYFDIDFDNSVECPSRPLPTKYLPTLSLSLVDADPGQTIASLLTGGRKRVFFMNAHCCNTRRAEPEYARAVAAADVLLPDGIGIALAGKMSGHAPTANLNGTDLVPELLVQAAKMGKSVFLFGGRPGTADAAAARLAFDIPSLRIAGTRDGYAGAADTQAVIDGINDSGADIVLVALGVPMQEIWLHRHAGSLNAELTMGVGALFDFLAGNVQRAPKVVRRAKLEWVWRLAMEPRRMAKRYLWGNVAFLAHAGLIAMHKGGAARAQKRALDILVSTTAILALAPMLALTALAIKLDSRGPVIFRQTRIGKDGKPFTMFKFRSMTTDAESRRSDLLETSDRNGVCFKARRDPRVTRIGRFIRRASIDELPQIFNVLRGEMSLVGPRPALPSEVRNYPVRAYGRLAVKPGITGIWQVSGRADIGFDQMVEMDLDYARRASVALDFTLILKTFGAVLSGRGAY